MKLNISNKTKIVLICVSGLIVIALAIFTALLLTTKNKNDSVIDSEIKAVATITGPKHQTIELLDNSKTLIFTIKNKADNDEIKIFNSDDTIATISNEYKIIPHKVGTTTATISLTESGINYSIYLEIIDCTKTVEFELTDLNNNPIDDFYTDKYYLLHIFEDYPSNTTPQILSSMSDFNLLSYNSGEFIFTFKNNTPGEFSFIYNGKYFSYEEKYNVRELPTAFNVNFSADINNNYINLYLFDKNYETQANLDSVFDFAEFTIQKSHPYDDVEINLIDNENNVVYLNNNALVANSIGTCQLQFKSKISGFTLTYFINVQSINIGAISVNNTMCELGDEENITLKQNQEYYFEFYKLPIYSPQEIDVTYNQDEISFNDNIIKLITNHSSTFLLKIDNNIIYTVNICYDDSHDEQNQNNEEQNEDPGTNTDPGNDEPGSQENPPEQNDAIRHEITLESTYLCNASIDGSTIAANIESAPAYLQLSIIAKENEITLNNQLYEISIDNENICRNADAITTTNIINLEILSTGETNLHVFDKINNMEIVLLLSITQIN